jgi:hypothetical protein
MNQPWYKNAYRRVCIDMHITDDDERFLTQFDAATYVQMLQRCHAQSAVVYAHSHVGLCYYPSQVAPMHRNLRGRNIVREMTDLCHEQGIGVAMYMSLIFDTAAYRAHPDWRIVGANGKEVADQNRYGVCCPNSPYRDYAAAIARELCTNFDLDGIRFDMTFWPNVCYCSHCQRRFAAEVGGELPKIINWSDPVWVSFQRKREQWLAEFAAHLTAAAKSVKPAVSVEHQASTYFHSWRFGVTTQLAKHNDFLQGDFYGDALQGSMARKVIYNLSENLPGAFETCIAVDLRNYTALKSKELLTAKSCAALADASAFLFIDTIDPIGTFNPAVYERMEPIFAQMQKYEPFVGGERCQDVAVYLSTESKWDWADNGKAVDNPHLSSRAPHVDAVTSVCRALIDEHIPFGVITKRNLNDLARFQAIILPDVLFFDAEEAAALREYVRNGGALYASRYTSLVTKDGRRQPDFLLADVFGVTYEGETKEKFTYMAPTAAGHAAFAGYTRQHPLGLYDAQVVVKARPGAEILATLTLPFTDPADPVHFASIHNNPPGVDTDHPAAVLNRYGQGKAIYVAGDLESLEIHRAVFANLLGLLCGSFSAGADAPGAVEITAFHQADHKRFIVSLINFQKDLPNIPVDGIRVKVRLDGRTPQRVALLPDGATRPFAVRDGYLEFTAPRLETFAMFAVEYA